MEHRIDSVEAREISDVDLRAVYEVERELALEAAPEDGFVDLGSFARQVRNEPADWSSTFLLVAGAGHAKVGWRESPENRHIASVWIAITAPARRRGLGRELLAEAAAVAEPAGRTLLMGDTTARRPAGEAFCLAVGAEAGLVEHENRLDLGEVDGDLVARWLQPRTGYELVAVDGPVAPALQDAAARLLEVMNDAPRGDLRAEDDHETPEQVAAFEAMIASGGTQLRTIYARHLESGELAGFTRVSWHPSQPAVVWQWGTAVERGHRGHGLGRWMKGTMLDRILRELPLARSVVTTNATTNRWMLAINRELGFRPVSSVTTWQVDAAKVRYNSAQPARPLE